MDNTKLRDSARGGKCSHARTVLYRCEKSSRGFYTCNDCGRATRVRCYLRLIEEWGLDQ